MRHSLSSTLLGKWRLSLALGLLVILMMGSVYQSSAARAAGSGPIIHWNSSMIYAGQNNGNPWGPVGENASVNGQNFPVNRQLRLILVAGDSNNTPTACKTSVVTVSSVTTDNTGQFAQNFSWPVSAGEVNKEYSICAVSAGDANNVVSSRDDGPFTVLSASPPVIALSASSVTAGATLTITGHSWVPPQPVNINIAGCADCEPGNTEVASTVIDSMGLNDGSFSVSVTIPASTKTGNYVVNAFTQSGLDANYIVGSGVQHLAINGATPTATATSPATVTPTATATVAATATVTATTLPTVTATTVTSNSNTSTNDSSGGGNGPMLLLFVALGVLLLAIAGVVIFMLLQRSSLGKRPSSNTSPAYAHNRGQSVSPYGGPSSNPGNATESIQYMQQDRSQSLYGENAQISNSLVGFGQTGGSGANYGSNQQATQQYGTAYTHGGYGQLSNGARSAQQPGPASMHNEQTVAMQNYGGYGTIAGSTPNLAQCRNCGWQLNPNDLRCGGCRMPVANPHTSLWG